MDVNPLSYTTWHLQLRKSAWKNHFFHTEGFSYLLQAVPSLGGERSLAGRGGVGRRQPLQGSGQCQGGLQVDRLVEKLVADQNDQGEETQLEVAERVGGKHKRDQ